VSDSGVQTDVRRFREPASRPRSPTPSLGGEVNFLPAFRRYSPTRQTQFVLNPVIATRLLCTTLLFIVLDCLHAFICKTCM
jgi:hypothetical protein